jgi:hypothetical protein
MNQTEKLTIINNHFTAEEAKEILMNLFNSKLNFLNIKNWSSQERFGKNDVIAEERIPALKSEIKRLEEILTEAKNNNKKLVVNSEIYISLQENEE